MTRVPDVGAAAPTEGGDLAALYRAHGSEIVRLAYVLTGDAQVAQDLAQEAFVRVGRKLFGLRNPALARAYLYRTTVNLGRGRFRRLKAERAALARLPRPGSEQAPDLGTQQEVWAAVLRLPPRQRAALFLRYYQDLSERDAAETLGCSLGALKSLVNRGLHEMRSILGGGGNE